MSQNALDQIDALFDGRELPGDPGGALAALIASVPGAKPEAAWLVTAQGSLLACRADEGETGEALETASRELIARLAGKTYTFESHSDGGAVALRSGGNGSPVLMLRYADAIDAAQFEPLIPLLAFSARALLASLEATSRAEQAAVRMRHLIAERDTLKDSYATTMSSALEEREQRLRDQQRHVDQLEDEVAKRSADLRVALDKAELANASKSAFLANMSHEIRTPMTAILGYADLVAEDSWGRPTTLERIEIIRRNGHHLLELINDILDISKIEAGKMEVERVECSPVQIAREVADLMQVRAKTKGLEFRLAFEGPIPRTIQTDPTRLRQILTNLVGNALKFTDKGSVTLAVLLRGKQLAFDIRDTGIGMTAEQQARLFQPFTQADASTTRRFGGTGLGLTICKRLSNMLGGDIELRSEIGKGSTFTAAIDPGPIGVTDMPGNQNSDTAPAPAPGSAAPAAAAPAPIKPKPLAGAKLLLAEDGPDNQMLIKLVLKNAGADVTVAGDGVLACEAVAKARGEGFAYDVILMDMQMPRLDGYGATAKLRADGYAGAIIALTANAMSSDRAKCLDAGCTDFASKPIDTKKLIALIDKYRSGQVPAAPPPGSAATPAKQPPAPLASTLPPDPDMNQLVADFAAHLPQRARDMLAALRGNDVESLKTLAHQIKGSAGSFGYDPITRVAGELERLAIDGSPADRLQKTLDELTELCHRAAAGVPKS